MTALPKPHIPAAPRNEGARRLLWWLLDPTDRAERAGRFTELRARGIGEIERERLLTGELLPDVALAARLSHITRGAVRWQDWQHHAYGPWAERPADRTPLKQAA